jgi:hypothetical protein
MATNDVSRTVISAPFRFIFPKLLKAEAYKGDKGSNKEKGAPVYSTGMLFNDDDLTKFKMLDDSTDSLVDVDIRRVCMEMAKEAWGADFSVKDAVAHGGMKWPIVTGQQLLAKAKAKNKKTDSMSHYEGAVSQINCKAYEDYPPALNYSEGGKWKGLTRGISDHDSKIKALFTSGSYGQAELRLRTSIVDERKYIVFYVNVVNFLKTGPRIGGQSLMDRLAGVSGGTTDNDPTKGLDDDMPV